MIETGMIRKLDDLGRIVIPKEIRATLNLIEGMPLKIYINENNEITLKTFSYVCAYQKYARIISDNMARTLNKTILISDESKFVSASGRLGKYYEGKFIGTDLIRVFERKQNYLFSNALKTTQLKIVDKDAELFLGQLIIPILANDKVLGMLVVLSAKDEIDKTSILCAEILSNIFGEFLSAL